MSALFGGEYREMKYHEQHEEFKRLAIRQGLARLEQLNQALPFGYTVPALRINRWLNGMLALPSEFSAQRRYVNRFRIGADPEFIFVKDGQRVNAMNLHLAQGLAYGMDNNGRLIEIRPHPNRSALHVTASILATLRWLSILVPETMSYDWVTGAYLLGDGLGGHVHFGRKRPGRDLEVKALDVIDDELVVLKAYPAGEVARRRQGDEHNNHPYGLPGDIRPQRHGYEYRTFPSWLDSPELAFLTMTLSKLAVQTPQLTQGYMPLTADRHLRRLQNLLSYYKDVDDDARLALCMVAKHMPIHIGGDFKKRWGIEAATLGDAPKVSFLPSSIRPTQAEVTELFEYFRDGKALGYKIPEPTWAPLNPLDGYIMALKSTDTRGAKGLGELLWDVVMSKELPLRFVSSPDVHGGFFSIPSKLANILPTGWRKLASNKINVHFGDENFIYSSAKGRETGTFDECRRLLLDTVLPLWRISDVKADSYLQWKSASRKKPARNFNDKLLSGDASQLPLRDLR